jgi:phosphatidylinositol alpha 1,6-mannosyltransferase
MLSLPRVAFFPDSFHEVNGVAHTSRNFVAYAERHKLPFLCVRAGTKEGCRTQRIGSVDVLELNRSPIAIGMEHDLHYDLLFWRHAHAVTSALERFRPDVIHITGPSELGLLGAYFAHKLDIPLASAWQTNLHEYIPMRLARFTRYLPFGYDLAADRGLESWSLNALLSLYRRSRIIFAPNRELCDWLTEMLKLPCHLMNRGIDTELFSPVHRSRRQDTGLVLGYVGRLSLEKNVGVLPGIATQLEELGFPEVSFLIVGQGAEEAYLRSDLRRATFTGVLRGEALAKAYANMDMLIFPSHTDTFGNVVLEALGSGIPAIVTAHGGPKHIVHDGETGIIISADHEPASRGEAILFAQAIATVARDPERLRRMGKAAREYALGCTWDSIFDGVYTAYERALTDKLAKAGVEESPTSDRDSSLRDADLASQGVENPKAKEAKRAVGAERRIVRRGRGAC